MTHENSPTDASFDASTEQTLYGEPRHEVRGDDDEQTLYGDPQHESSGDIGDAWDVELLFARMQSASEPVAPDEFGSRTAPSAVESTER